MKLFCQMIVWLAAYILLVWNVVYSVDEIADTIFNYIPASQLSFCTRKLNLSHQIGCSSKLGGNFGTVLFVSSSHQIINDLISNNESEYILVMGVDFFTNVSFMHHLRYLSNVEGVVVFTDPLKSNDTYSFSESLDCPNSMYSFYNISRQCLVNEPEKWNQFGSDYSTTDWPFPVVLVQDLNLTIKNFNENPKDDTRCTIEIKNPMSAVGNTRICSRRQYLMSMHIFDTPTLFCDELTGLNIILAVNNKSTNNSNYERPENSSLLVITRMDSRSMFEKSGYASQGVIANVAVLLSTAVHLMKQQVFKTGRLKKDLFFGFLDNEAYDFMGSHRLVYDLDLALHTRYPLSWNSLYAVLELGEIGIAKIKEKISTYYMTYDETIHNETANQTESLCSNLMAACNKSGKILLEKPSTRVSKLPLSPTASLQTLLKNQYNLPHILITDHGGPPFNDKNFESFLDIQWPPKDIPNASTDLLNFANVLTDAIYREVTNESTPIEFGISYPSPGDFMDCFLNNPACDIFKQFLSLTDMALLRDSHVSTQTYLPLENYELKFSYLVKFLLIGLTGEKTDTPNCPPLDQHVPYSYIMGYFNGSEQCYKTFLYISSGFVLSNGTELVAPAWVRSRVVSDRYLRWYRSTSPTIEAMTLSLGIFFIIITFIIFIYMREKIKRSLIIPLIGITGDFSPNERL